MTRDTDLQGADLANWRFPGHLRVAFRNLDRLLTVADIPGAAGGGRALPSASLPPVEVAGEDGTALSLAEVLARTSTSAFVALVDGAIVHEFYDAGTTAETPHLLHSITKSITGLLGAILVEAGVVDPDAPVSRLVPEVAASGYRGATLRHLLDMRASIRWDDAVIARYRAASGWDPHTEADARFGAHAFLAAAQADEAGHGGPFRYISSNCELAAWVFERATGQSLASLLSTLLWQPAGAADRAFITIDRQGAARCSGGLCATARDLARIGQLMIDGGRWNGRQVLPPGLLDDLLHGGDRLAWDTGAWAETFPLRAGHRVGYRSFWYATADAPAPLFAWGVHGQTLFLDPARRLVVVKLSHDATAIDRPALAQTQAAVEALARTVRVR